MNNLYETNPILFWLIGCIIAGVFWGFVQSSLWGGLIYGGILFALAMGYEAFFHKNDRPKK